MTPNGAKMEHHRWCLIPVLLVLLFTEVSSTVPQGVSLNFTTVDGSTTFFNFTGHNSSNCIYTINNGPHIACMSDQSFLSVEATWQTKGTELQYVKVNCLQQNTIRRSSRYCVCKSGASDVDFPCQVTKLDINMFRTLGNLQVMDLSFNKIQEIGRRTFNGLTQMKFLSLRHNDVTNNGLPYGLLCDAPSLEYLDLRELDFDVFPSQIFKCNSVTSKIKAIDISNSRLNDVPNRSMDPLTALESLNLGNNLLGKLLKNSFEGASSMMHLNVSGNMLYDLFPDFCATLPKLETFLLSDNEFKTFNFNELEDCSEIKTLDISMNNITGLSGSVSNLTKLEKLDVSHNYLQTFNLDLNNNSKLQYLDISHNNIKNLDTQNLKNLTSLVELKLDHNFINDAPNFSELFQKLTNLLSLDLSYNMIKDIPNNSFVGLVNLTKLYLNDNQLTTLHNNSFAGLGNLKHLHLENNNITDLPSEVFQSLVVLEYISLENNHIATLIVDFWPSTVHFLLLGGNMLTTVPENVNYSAIEVLDFSGNSLSDFNIKGQIATNLKSIDLSFNKITDINQTMFDAAPNLEYLNLENNALTLNLSSSVFSGALKLEMLNLANNRIGRIGNMFSENSLPSLKTLNVSFNSVTSVTQLATDFTGSVVNVIDLSNNSITTLDSNTFTNLDNLTSAHLRNNFIQMFEIFNSSRDTTFDFSGNPIICSCNLVWLKDPYVEIDKKRIPTYRYHVPKCTAFGLDGLYSPQNLRRDQYLCIEEKGCDPSCVCSKTDPNGEINTVKCRNQLENVPSVIPASASTIYLDGNSFINGTFEAFSTFTNMSARELYLNGSGIGSLHPMMLQGFPHLEIISLAGNKLKTIPASLFTNKTTLKQLFLQNNLLSSFEPGTFEGLDSLKELDISGNKFKYLSPTTTAELDALPAMKYFFLANNSWRCDCRNLDFKEFIDKVQFKIRDRRQLVCNGQEIIYVPKSSFICAAYDKPPINYAGKTVLVVISCIVILFIICATCLYFKRECVAMLYSVTGIHIPSRQRYTTGKPFDVFLSYDPLDQHASEYVQTQLLPKLRISRHHCQTSHDLIQDVEVTRKAIEDSKCSVFIINKNFATSSYLVKVFQIATEQSNLGHHKVILLIHGDIDILTLEPEIVTRLRRGDYITARSRLWWCRLQYELPVSTKFQGNRRDDDEESEADTIIFSAIADEGYYNSMTDS